MSDGVHAPNRLLQALARHEVLDFDELDPVRVLGIPLKYMLRLWL